MRLTALTTVKIEGDIVEEFVRYTLRFVDHVIVVDNGSLDAGREILRELESEGLSLSIWDGEAVPSRHEGWGAFARRAFATVETDYLLMLDVDEFVRAPSRRALEEQLCALAGAHGLVPWVTYVPTPEDDADEARVLARVRHRLRREPRPVSKVFVHRSFMEHELAWIVPGNHAVCDPTENAFSSVLTGIELAHIPVRSLKQIQSKALVGWPQIIALGFSDQQETGYQWRRLNDRLLHDPHWDTKEFYRFAWRYLEGDGDRPEFVLDPLPPTDLRYRRDAPELLALAVAFTRQYAFALAARAPYLTDQSRSAAPMTNIDNHHDVVMEDRQVDARDTVEGDAAGDALNAIEAVGLVSTMDALGGQGTLRAVDSVNNSSAGAVHSSKMTNGVGPVDSTGIPNAPELEALDREEFQGRQRADAQASLQATLRSEAVDALAAETQRYQTRLQQQQAQLRELQALIRDMQQSNSWRFTQPIRLAGLFLRGKLKRQ